MRPDAIPVRPLVSRAVLPPEALAALFGAKAVLRPTARVALVRAGREIARVAVETGPQLAVVLDQTDAVDGPVRIQGPVGASAPVTPTSVRSYLEMPDGLRRAWGVSDRATLGLGPVALAVEVARGPEVVACLERAVWLGGGMPETARWLPGIELAPAAQADAPDDGALRIPRRVITENDVRRARLGHRRIQLTPGQIVTPAARSLAREWNVFEPETGG